MQFPHPHTGEQVCIESPLAEEFAAILRALDWPVYPPAQPIQA